LDAAASRTGGFQHITKVSFALAARRMLAWQAYLGPPRSESGLPGIRPKAKAVQQRRYIATRALIPQ